MNENNHLNLVLAALYDSFDYKLDKWFRNNNFWPEVETWEYYDSFDYKLDKWFRNNNFWAEVETWEYWEVIV